MLNTNKKFFDKKNIIKAQDGNNLFKFTMNKNDQVKSEGNEENNGFKERQCMYSIPYEPEDEYAQLVKPFESADFDIAYQLPQKAFPYHLKSGLNAQLFSISQPQSYICPQFQFAPIHQSRQLISFYGSDEMKQDMIMCFERESTEEEDLEEQESTKENSNRLGSGDEDM